MTKKLFLIISVSLLLAFSVSLYIPLSEKNFEPFPVVSLQIFDREGNLMREVLSDEGGRCRWVSLEEIPSGLLQMTVAAEDKNFYLHPGVDISAVFRAIGQNLSKKRIVSGASTITQQLVRNLFHHRRNIFSKILEAWLALRIEHQLTKEEILVQYLNRICYGNQVYGIAAASRFYFDKAPGDLSLAESAFLAGLPRSPSRYNPLRFFKRAKARQITVLMQAFGRGYLGLDELSQAKQEPLVIEHASRSFRAPHFCDYILKSIPVSKRRQLSAIHTTVDLQLQEKIEIMVKSHLDLVQAKNITNAAVVVLDNRTGDILCMVGSRDFFDYRIDGQVNGAVSLRQPGSTLKPFTYALALEKGMTAATIIRDEETFFPTQSGSFRPQNYDHGFHGPIRLRTALACSYNIPAVSILQSLGPDILYRKLHEAGFVSLQKPPDHYGIGLTLGSGEVTLVELVTAYSSFARKGSALPPRILLFAHDHSGREVPLKTRKPSCSLFSEQVSYIITHILADGDARVPAFGFNTALEFPFPAASKTGTSKDFRDNWTIGYSPRYTVGVWVGNFNGKSMHNISGISGCGPLYHDIMLLLHKDKEPYSFIKPDGLVSCSICPASGELASENCPGAMKEIFIKKTQPRRTCSVHNDISPKNGVYPHEAYPKESARQSLKIHFPVEGDIFKMDPVLRKEYQIIRFKAVAPALSRSSPLTWRLNGNRIGTTLSPHRMAWRLQPGSYILEVTSETGKEDSMTHAIRFKVLK